MNITTIQVSPSFIMTHTLDEKHNSYIIMKVIGVLDRESALSVIKEILNHPDYPIKHTLWDLTSVQMRLSVDDFREISGILKLYKPPDDDFANRSAFLVKNRLELAMANVFIAITAFLPFQYKAFLDIENAISYLTKK